MSRRLKISLKTRKLLDLFKKCDLSRKAGLTTKKFQKESQQLQAWPKPLRTGLVNTENRFDFKKNHFE